MEWTGTQQIYHFLQSVILGAGLGMLFELFCVFVRLSKSPIWRFSFDVLYGVLASVITFFSALVITDGRLHPVLFMGSLCGFLCEHYSVGRFVSRGLTWLMQQVGKRIRFVLDWTDRFLYNGYGRLIKTGKRWYRRLKQRKSTQK